MTPPLMFDDRDGICIASLDGDVDLASARHLGSEILRRVSPEDVGVVIDLSGVTYLDSTGVSLIFDLEENLRERRQRLAIAVPLTSPLRKLFEITALDSVVPVVADIGRAAEAASAE